MENHGYELPSPTDTGSLTPATLAMQFNWIKRRLYRLESNKRGIRDKVKGTLKRGTWKTRACNSRIQMRVED